MGYLSKYISLNNSRGSTIKETRINSTKQTYLNSFTDSVSHDEVTYNDDTVTHDVQIIDNSAIKESKLILSKPDETLNTGDYVNWLSDKWLIVIKDRMGGIYERGTMGKCVSTIKWITKEGVVHEYGFVLDNDFRTLLGIQEGAVINTLKERRNIIVQFNEFTKTISLGQRFIFDDYAWKINGVNKLYTGIIHLSCEADTFDPSQDNIELRIADYKKYQLPIPEPEPEPNPVGIAFDLSVDKTPIGQLTLGQSKTYTVTVYNNNVVDNTAEIEWALYADNQTSSTTLATISARNNNAITLKANSQSNLGYIQLKCSIKNNVDDVLWTRIQVKGFM